MRHVTVTKASSQYWLGTRADPGKESDASFDNVSMATLNRAKRLGEYARSKFFTPIWLSDFHFGVEKYFNVV